MPWATGINGRMWIIEQVWGLSMCMGWVRTVGESEVTYWRAHGKFPCFQQYHSLRILLIAREIRAGKLETQCSKELLLCFCDGLAQSLRAQCVPGAWVSKWMNQQINTWEERHTYYYWLSEVFVHRSTLETGQVNPVETLLVPKTGSTKNQHASVLRPQDPQSCDALRGCLTGPLS